MVNFTDLVMFSNGVWQWRIKLSAMHKADSYVCFADVDIAHLLINPSFGDCLLQILRYFTRENVRARAVCTGRLWTVAVRDLARHDAAPYDPYPHDYVSHSSPPADQYTPWLARLAAE